MSSELTDLTTNDYLQDAVLDSADVQEFLDQLCRHAVQELSDGEEVLCGITLLRQKRAATVASSSEYARKMDEVQYSFNDGPCLTAAREQSTIRVPDLGQEQRWPDYIEAITGHGMHSVLAVSFNLEGEGRAALNLYSNTVGKFTDEVTAKATTFADEASRSLRLAVKVAHHSDIAADLHAAMATRTVIDIAIGIIMCQSRCSQNEAFEFLKKASSHRNIKLRTLAGQIVAGTGTNAPPHTHFDS
ncbi:GAF and ANTAR domain-containing protein [Arthrobacter monumenti]